MKYIRFSSFLLVIFLIGIISLGVFRLYTPPNTISSLMDSSPRELSLESPETPEMDATYYSNNETVDITVEDGNLTYLSDVVAVAKESRPTIVRNNDSITEELTISYKGREKKTKFWATRSFYGLGIGNKGVAEFPLKEGDTLHVVSDGTDTDGDGIEGIENEDWIRLYNKDHGNYVEFYEIKIKNDTALDMSSTARLCRNEARVAELNETDSEFVEKNC